MAQDQEVYQMSYSAQEQGFIKVSRCKNIFKSDGVRIVCSELYFCHLAFLRAVVKFTSASVWNSGKMLSKFSSAVSEIDVIIHDFINFKSCVWLIFHKIEVQKYKNIFLHKYKKCCEDS